MTDMVIPLRDMIPLGLHEGKLVLTMEGFAASKLYQQAISNYQELYFLEGILQSI